MIIQNIHERPIKTYKVVKQCRMHHERITILSDELLHEFTETLLFTSRLPFFGRIAERIKF